MVLKRAYKISQDADKAIEVMHSAAKWMEDSGIHEKHWRSAGMNRKSMLQNAEESEFYVLLIKGNPAAAAILQDNQRNQSWKSVDNGKGVQALYVHWLCVDPSYRGIGLPKVLLDFAKKTAMARGLRLLRLDTNAGEPKLMKVYEDAGFELIHIEQEGAHKTAFYQKEF